MEVLRLLTDNLGALAFAVLALGGVLAFCYAAWLYQTALGDQQQMMKARNCFFGGVIGILIGGFAFAIVEIISSEVLSRSGGEPIVARASSECDGVLRSRLAIEVHANTPERMRQIVRLIQAENEDGCGKDLWDPHIGEDRKVRSAWFAQHRIACFGKRGSGTQMTSREVGGGPRYAVAGVVVPGSLLFSDGYRQASDGPVPRPVSSRDSANNVIVYFGRLVNSSDVVLPVDGNPTNGYAVSDTLGRPTDGASCWMFLARENVWLSQ